VHPFFRASRWLVGPAEVHRGAEVLCLPHLSNHSAEFDRWPRATGNGVRISVLHCPADCDQEWWHDHATFPAQAADLIDDLRCALPERFAFFGHGDAALLAYEAAVELERRRMPAPAQLIVSGSPAPQDAWVSTPMPSDEDFAAQAVMALLEVGGSPLPSLVKVCARALRAQAVARRAYRVKHARRLSCPITAIGWSGAEECDVRSMSGWAECGDTTLVSAEGPPHRYAQAPPHLMRVIESVNGTR
jgi:surfactin synthase thioesterase subunit